jgi:hypothetical protein
MPAQARWQSTRRGVGQHRTELPAKRLDTFPRQNQPVALVEYAQMAMNSVAIS